MTKENKKIKDEGKKLNKERFERCVPIARKIIKLIAEADLPIGETHAHDNTKYNSVAKEILAIMLKHEAKYVDKDFIFQLILQPFDQLKGIVFMSLGDSLDKAIDKKFGKDFRELTLRDMDKILKE